MRSGSEHSVGAVKPSDRSGQDQGDQRRPARDALAHPGTKGDRLGLSGDERRILLRGFLWSAVVIAAVATINILTLRHDAPDLGPLRPVIWEVSSGLVIAAIFPLPALMAIWTTRTRPAWWRALPAHAVVIPLYSLLHVAGFVALRHVAHQVMLGERYNFGSWIEEFPYELRKDLLSYGLVFLAVWLLARLERASSLTTAASAPLEPRQFNIREGARLTRVAASDILAVTAAGNYAEFVLADGRKPLMRSSLAALEKDLAPLGLVRTHRSWLVNAARVTGLRPEGSGDYTVELGDLEAPVSRRFPQALAALRA